MKMLRRKCRRIPRKNPEPWRALQLIYAIYLAPLEVAQQLSHDLCKQLHCSLQMSFCLRQTLHPPLPLPPPLPPPWGNIVLPIFGTYYYYNFQYLFKPCAWFFVILKRFMEFFGREFNELKEFRWFRYFTADSLGIVKDAVNFGDAFAPCYSSVKWSKTLSFQDSLK